MSEYVVNFLNLSCGLKINNHIWLRTLCQNLEFYFNFHINLAVLRNPNIKGVIFI